MTKLGAIEFDARVLDAQLRRQSGIAFDHFLVQLRTLARSPQRRGENDTVA